MSWWSDGDEADDEGDYAEYDESSVRVRPNPKANRPRTKQRPTYADAEVGVVWTVDRGRYGVLMGAGTPAEHEITTARARELGKKAVVTGDRVDVVGDTSGADGSLARIVRVHDRSTLLRRSADDTDAVERVIVANADQMLIVVAAADPEPRPRLVDRYLVAAFDAGIEPILCITKTDLADPAAFAAQFSCLDLRVVTTSSARFTGGELDVVRELLDGHVTVTVGHSGVGKSTLVNALTGANRAVGVVNAVTGRGRHTSSSTVSFTVPTGGRIIDTPGVRSFGLGHVDPENILRSFAAHAVAPDGSPLPTGADAPDGVPLREAHDWEIVDRVEAGELGPVGKDRLESLLTLLGNRGAAPAG